MADKSANGAFAVYKLEDGLWNYTGLPLYYDTDGYQVEIPAGFKGIITVCPSTPEPDPETTNPSTSQLLTPELYLEKATLDLDQESGIIPYTCNSNGEVTVNYIGEDEPIGIRATIVQDKVVFSFDPETSVGTFIYRVSVAETEEYSSAYADIVVNKRNPNSIPV